MLKILVILFFPITVFAQNVILSGYIVDARTQEPIENAEVRLYMDAHIGGIQGSN